MTSVVLIKVNAELVCCCISVGLGVVSYVKKENGAEWFARKRNLWWKALQDLKEQQLENLRVLYLCWVMENQPTHPAGPA